MVAWVLAVLFAVFFASVVVRGLRRPPGRRGVDAAASGSTFGWYGGDGGGHHGGGHHGSDGGSGGDSGGGGCGGGGCGGGGCGGGGCGGGGG